MKERTTQEWLDDLRGPSRDGALADLRAVLLRGLGYSLANRSDVDGVLFEDFAPDALLRTSIAWTPSAARAASPHGRRKPPFA